MVGGAGNDLLPGGPGPDVFRFDVALNLAGLDTVTDFRIADDRIQLDDAVFPGLLPGSLPAAAFLAGAAATQAEHRILYDTTSGLVSYDPDGLGGQAPSSSSSSEPALS